MNLKTWDTTIQQIADESNHELSESGKHKVLTAWRSKLEKKPTSLAPFPRSWQAALSGDRLKNLHRIVAAKQMGGPQSQSPTTKVID